MTASTAFLRLLFLASVATASLTHTQALSHVHVRVHVYHATANATTASPSPLTTAAVSTIPDAVVGKWEALDANAYTLAACAPQEWTITRANAVTMALSFGAVNVPGDVLEVSAPDGSAAHEVKTATHGGRTTASIRGNSVRLAFRPSNASTTGCIATGKTPSFALERVVYELAASKRVAKEAVCGANTLKNAQCAADATMRRRMRAVVRVLFQRSDGKIASCTGWLWGNKGHIVTNHHCLANQAAVDTATFDFAWEAPSCRATCVLPVCTPEYTLQGSRYVQFIQSDARLDYAVVQIVRQGALFARDYGYLQLRDGAPAQGEEIYIPQHPKGETKAIATTDDDRDRAPATIKDTNYAVTVDGRRFDNLVGYAADTDEGSSGSPVIAKRDHLVVGLHRIGNCHNAATRSDTLANALRALVSSNDGVKK